MSKWPPGSKRWASAWNDDTCRICGVAIQVYRSGRFYEQRRLCPMHKLEEMRKTQAAAYERAKQRGAPSTMTKPRPMNAVIREFNGTFYEVFSADAPAHLQTMWLTSSQVRTAKTGDRVRLEYRSIASMGEWVVAEVLG